MAEHYQLPKEKKWISISECVKQYGIPMSTIQQALAQKRVKGTKRKVRGGKVKFWAIDPASFAEFLKTHEKYKRPGRKL